VSVISSDGGYFWLRRINLQVMAGGFALGPTDGAAAVTLAETESTLDLLFDFVYPAWYPTLGPLEFEALREVAEAAEKYQVYRAQEVLRARMRYV
jgi:hypothetical protein